MKTQLLGIIAGIAIGVPVIVSGSSIVSSLIDGKTLEESVVILADQIDGLLTRVSILETDQAQIVEEINALKTGQLGTGSNIVETNLELEKLRLENEKLKTEATDDKLKIEATIKAQNCEALSRVKPEEPHWNLWGDTPTIIAFYDRASDLLNGDPMLERSENRNKIKEEIQEAYVEAKSLYEVYVSVCE